MSAHMTTPLQRSMWSRYSGRLLHTMEFHSGRTLCGRFVRADAGWHAMGHVTPPTCKQCLNRDPRFTVQKP